MPQNVRCKGGGVNLSYGFSEFIQIESPVFSLDRLTRIDIAPETYLILVNLIDLGLREYW